MSISTRTMTTAPGGVTVKFWFILFLAGLVLSGPLTAVAVQGSEVRTRLEHSAAKHGAAEVLAIHKSLECNGPDSVWSSRSWKHPNKQFWLCEVEPDKWGVMIVQKLKNGDWMELTTFMLGKFGRAIEYLSAIAVQVE